MKIDIIQIGIIGLFIIAAWFVAFIDGLFFQFNLGFLIVFPFLLLIIYFFTRYNDNRWIFISSFLFLYLLIFTIPIWVGLIILLIFISIEKILTSVLHRFNIVQVFVITTTIILSLSFVYEYQVNLLSWQFIEQGWFITNIQEHFIRILLGFLFSFSFYPLFSIYESKNKLYLSKY